MEMNQYELERPVTCNSVLEQSRDDFIICTSWEASPKHYEMH